MKQRKTRGYSKESTGGYGRKGDPRLSLSMGDRRFISIGPDRDTGGYQVNYVNRSRLLSARKRGWGMSPANATMNLKSVEDLRNLPNRRFVDEDMKEPLSVVIDNYLSGAESQPSELDLNYERMSIREPTRDEIRHGSWGE